MLCKDAAVETRQKGGSEMGWCEDSGWECGERCKMAAIKNESRMILLRSCGGSFIYQAGEQSNGSFGGDSIR